MEGVEKGDKSRGKLLKDVRFADDQGMAAECEVVLQKIMNSLHSTATKDGMKINIKQTKVMRVVREGVK